MPSAPHRSFVAVLAAAAFLLVGASPAGAAELSVAQPSACDLGDELLHAVERALGQPLAAAAEVRCTVEVLREGEGFTARLGLASPGSEQPLQQRSLSAPSCEKLTELLTVAVVLAVGAGSSDASPSVVSPAAPAADLSTSAPAPAPTAALATTPPAPARASAPVAALATPAPAAELASAVEDTPSVVLAAAPQAEPDEGSRWGAHTALVMDAGSLPAPAMGALLGGSLGWEQLELRALGTYLFPRAGSIEASSGGSLGAELALLTSTLLGCAPRLLRTERLELGACAGAELGWLWGNGTSVSAPRQNGGPWSAARAELGARWGVGPPWLGFDVRLSALLPFQRHRFALKDDGDSRRVHQPGAVVGRLSLGVSVELE